MSPTVQETINEIRAAHCLQCKTDLGDTYIQLTYYPGGAKAGRQYTVCSDRCLTKLLIGAES